MVPKDASEAPPRIYAEGWCGFSDPACDVSTKPSTALSGVDVVVAKEGDHPALGDLLDLNTQVVSHRLLKRSSHLTHMVVVALGDQCREHTTADDLAGANEQVAAREAWVRWVERGY